jgi:AraC-like DNA-binding protein
MENDKPYLKFNLNLAELAEMVNLTRNQLSFVINQKHRMNFNEYINSYRIEEVKRLMVDPANQHLKLMSLAYDAGFNSKASFNRIFKKLTDMTPSQYFTMEKAG